MLFDCTGDQPHVRLPVAGGSRRIFLSAGDVSGDLHAAALIRALRERAGWRGMDLDIRAVGGPRMQAAGARLVANNSGLSSVGLVESLPFLHRAWSLRRRARAWLRDQRPDLAILIDYPGINIPLAGQLSRAGVPVLYYIPPEEWLWTTKGNRLLDRTEKLARSITQVLAVHQVEADFYRQAGCPVELVGHPLVDQVANQPIDRQQARSRLGLGAGESWLALLPASRPQELRLVWPVLAEAAARLRERYPELGFLLPVATPELAVALTGAVTAAVERFPVLRGGIRLLTREEGGYAPATLAIAAADLALTKSGSATVEIALHNVPQVVVYRLSAGTIWLGRHLLGLTEADIANFTLVNHILQRPLVPELLLHRATAEGIATTAARLLPPDARERSEQLQGYAMLRERLGPPGAAYRAAAVVWRYLEPHAPLASSPVST